MRIGEGREGPNGAFLLSPIKRLEVLTSHVHPAPVIIPRRLQPASLIGWWGGASQEVRGRSSAPRCVTWRNNKQQTTNNKTNHDSAKKQQGWLFSPATRINKSINKIKTPAVTQRAQRWIRPHILSIMLLGVMIQHIWHFKVPLIWCEATLGVCFLAHWASQACSSQTSSNTLLIRWQHKTANEEQFYLLRDQQ